jgi:hypothetical protein
MRHNDDHDRGSNADWNDHESAATSTRAPNLRSPCPRDERDAETPRITENSGRVGGTGRTAIEMRTKRTIRFAAQRGDVRREN